MKTHFIALTLALTLSTSAAMAQIGQVRRINLRGSEYAVTDVKSHTHKWKLIGPKTLILNTVVINKEGDQVAGYPVAAKVSELTKDDLKAIPDFRPIEQRHPFRAFVLKQGPNIILTAFSFAK